MLTINSVIQGYEIRGIDGTTVFATNYNPRCPQPYVVWDLDNDKNGVNHGRYYSDFKEAFKKYKDVISEKKGERSQCLPED